MDPARTFKESLTSRPELENSQGQNFGDRAAAPACGIWIEVARHLHDRERRGHAQ